VWLRHYLSVFLSFLIFSKLRTLKLNAMKKTIYHYFIDKYLLSNPDWHPFGDLEYDLSFIPVQFHSMFSRVAEIDNELPF